MSNLSSTRQEMMRLLNEVAKLNKVEASKNKPPIHAQKIGNLVSFLESRTKRAALESEDWRDISEDVLDYLEGRVVENEDYKKGNAVKFLPCHADIIGKIFLNGGEANKLIPPRVTRQYFKYLCKVIKAADDAANVKILQPLVLTLHERKIHELLKFQELRAALDMDMILSLTELFLAKIEASIKETDMPSRVRFLGVLQSLFLEMRRDDGHVKQKFCAKVFKELGAHAEEMGRKGAGEKEKISFFRAVTEFLLTFAPQHFGLAKDLCTSLHNLVKDSWGRTGIDALKRSLVDYLLVFVRARLAEPGQIKDCYEILERNISIININAHDALGQVTTDILSDSKHVLLLLSDLLHLYLKQLMGEGSAREGVDGGEAPAKRAKGTPPLESILLLTFPASQAAAQPQVNWLQFLCVFMESYPGDLDEDFCCKLIRGCRKSLTTKLDESTCPWICKTIIHIQASPRVSEWAAMGGEISAMFQHIVEQLKARRLKHDNVTGSLLRLLHSSLRVSQVPPPMVYECMPLIWSTVSSAIRADFLKMPSSNTSVNETTHVLQLQEAFSDFVCGILRVNPLSDARNADCSRQSLLAVLFEKMREWGPRYWGARPGREWFSLMANMIMSTVCNTCDARSIRVVAADSEGAAGASCLDESRKVSGWWQFESHEETRERSQEELYMMRLFAVEEHMAPGVHGGTAQLRRDSLTAADAAASPLVVASVLSEVGSAELQKMCLKQFEGLYSQLKQDGSASTVVLPLLVELIDSAVQLGCASSSSQHILKHLLQMLMREDADVSIQFFIKNAGAFAVGSSHSADAMEALQRYTDVLFRARGALPDHFDDSSLNRMVASISQSCCGFLNADNVESDPIEVDDFDTAPIATATKKDTRSKAAAIDMLLKLRSLHGSSCIQSEVSAVRNFALAEDRSWGDVLLFLGHLFRHPNASLNTTFMRLVQEMTAKKSRFNTVTKARRERVAFLAISRMSEAYLECKMTPAAIGILLKSLLDDGSALDQFSKRLKACQNAPADQDGGGDEQEAEMQVAGIGRDVKHSFVICVGRMVLLSRSDANSNGIVQPYLATILECLRDSAWEVRQEAANALPCIFFSTNPWDAYGSVIKVFSKKGQVEDSALARTRVQTFGHILGLPDERSQDSIEAHALLMLCKDFVAAEDMVSSMLSSISSARGFAGLKELFTSHMPSILRQWIYNGKSWKNFPYRIAGFTSQKEFVLESAARYLVPEFYLSGQRDAEIEEIGRVYDLSRYARNKLFLKEEMFIHSLVRVCHLGCYNVATDANLQSPYLKPLCQKANERFADLERVEANKQRIGSGIDDLLIQVLDLIVCDIFLEDFSPSTTESEEESIRLMVQIIGWIAKYTGTTSPGMLLGIHEEPDEMDSGEGLNPMDPRKDRLQCLLLHLMRIVKCSRRQREKRRALTATRMLLSILKDHLMLGEHAWALHHIVWFLLVSMGDVSVRQSAAELMKCELVGPMAREGDPARKGIMYSVLGPVFQDIVCSMLPYSLDGHASNVYRDVIELLIVNAPAALDHVIKDLPPFPEVPLRGGSMDFFKKVRERCGRTRSDDWSLEDDVQVFIDGSDDVNSEVQMVRLQHLYEQLKVRGGADLPRIRDKEAQSEGGDLLTLCVCKLLRLGRSADHSSDMVDLIARCLGQIGPVVSRSLSLSLQRPPHLPDIKAVRRGGKEHWKIVTSKIEVAILQKLRVFLVDPNIDVVCEAAKLLKNIFYVDNASLVTDVASVIQSGNGLDSAANQWLVPYIHADIQEGEPGYEHLDRDLMSLADEELWFPSDEATSTSYSDWITRLAHQLCAHDQGSSRIKRMCADMCLLKPEFAELLFPHLLFGIFADGREDKDRDALRAPLSSILKRLLRDPRHDLRCVRLVLAALDVFRSFHQDAVRAIAKSSVHTGPAASALPFSVRAWRYRYWFDIPYNTVAAASLRCDAQFSAILYMELHCTEDVSSRAGMRRSNTFKVGGEEEENESLMLNAYRQIDEPDGISAFNLRSDFSSHMIAYEQEEMWGKSLGLFDTLSSSKSMHLVPSMQGVSAVSAMHNCGYTHLPLMAARHAGGGEALSEALWRSGVWDESEEEAGRQHRGFHGFLLDALRALQKMDRGEGFASQVDTCISLAARAAITEVSGRALESTKNSHPALVKLQCCQDVSDFCSTVVQAGQEHGQEKERPYGGVRQGERVKEILDRWEQRYKSLENRFSLQEPAIALHCVLLGLCKSDYIKEQLCMAAKHSLKQGNVSYARCSMQRLQVLQTRDREAGMSQEQSVWLRQAKVLWHDGRRDQAIKILSDLEGVLEARMEEGKGSTYDKKMLARVLTVNAEWLSTTRTERWENIRQKMERGLELRQASKMPIAKAHFKLASFFDGMYCHEEEEWNTEKMRGYKEDLERSHRNAEVNSKEQKRLGVRLKAVNHQIMQREERKVQRDEFMRGALSNYLSHIRVGLASVSAQKGAAFRILQIWFENSHSEEVNSMVLSEFDRISFLDPFVILIPQMISRLDAIPPNGGDFGFQQALRGVIYRLLDTCINDTLFPIFAAKNGNRHRKASGSSKGGSVTYTVNTHRIEAAEQLIARLEADAGDAKDVERLRLLEQTRNLIEAYIELADKVHKKGDEPRAGITYDVTQKLKNVRFGISSKCSVPTDPGSMCKVDKFGTKWSYPGGVTFPKQIECFATTGRMFKQIVKGGDDPRCDAVTSQLFNVMGMLLRDDGACRRRELTMKRYNVIPLHPEAGIIEFVDGTVPLSRILGDGGLNSATLRDRFRENSTWKWYTSTEIRRRMMDIINESNKARNQAVKESQRRRETAKFFREVLDKTRPVFRHYFFEKVCSAPMWFQKRLAYTRSVASSSMAGFIAGLGDRHTSNILMIEDTGELLHIDLGIVFGQGRLLSEPELVPFRLTRELIDGFGVSGTSGVFTRSCEETLRVLRDNKQALLAIVDVLLHDPLMSWRMSTKKKENVQHKGASESAKQSTAPVEKDDDDDCADADMVRNEIRDKLEGRDRGEMLGVEGQVKQLIHDATNEENLAHIFRGWSAWL